MTANDFRRLALALPETEERAHMSHPDFRVCGNIFATLGYPDKSRGMVKLSPEQQHYFSKDCPDAFVPVKGAWGRRGATSVNLKATKKETMRKAIEAAWRNTAPQRLAEQFQGEGQPGKAQTAILVAPPSCGWELALSKVEGAGAPPALLGVPPLSSACLKQLLKSQGHS